MSDVIAGFGGLAWVLVFFVIAISIIVAVHEYGHYIVGRWSGIYAEVFCIGLGPVIYARRDRRGTIWQISALPLGGYVKFKGDGDIASTPMGRQGYAGYRMAAHHARRTAVGAGGDSGGGSCV